MDLQAIIARVESIIASGVEDVEKVLHDALDTVEKVLGLGDDADEPTGEAAAATDGTLLVGDAPAQMADAGNVDATPTVGTSDQMAS